MPCRLCSWLCERVCSEGLSKGSFWDKSQQWEATYSHDWEPWDENDERRARANDAVRLFKSEPEDGMAQLVELADEGSVFAMRWVATIYRGGHGIERNLVLAEDFFGRAISAGSWISTLSYSNLLYDRGAHDEWLATLADGVDKGFIPAFFWKAWNSYRRKPSRKIAEKVLPLLQRAAEAGHPGAKVLIAKWTARGRFGYRNIPEGFRMLRRATHEFARF